MKYFAYWVIYFNHQEFRNHKEDSGINTGIDSDPFIL